MMYLETIRIENGVVQNIELHQKRLENTIGKSLDLKNNIIVPPAFRTGRVKCRIAYYEEGVQEIKYTHYSPKKIKSLKAVDVDFDYHLKYADRSNIAQAMLQKEDCDDILMIKNGLVTDTSYANVVVKIDEKLWTPTKPLLKGVKRLELLTKGDILECELTLPDLQKADAIFLINAMLNIGEVEISPHNIF